MDDLNNDLENNNLDIDNPVDLDSLSDSGDESTYARFDFESFDLDEFLRRYETPSANRKWSLFEAPEFVQRLNPFEEVRAGSTVVFECKWKGCPKPSVKWYKDDEEITENPRYSVTEETDGLLKLTIDGATKEDEGAYKVKAENSEGVTSSTGYLSVTGDVSDRPSAAAQPRKNLDHHSVSFPPHLRTIVEQASLEEREEEELCGLPPSPIQGYIDSFRRGHRGPLFPGCTEPDYGDYEGDSAGQDGEDSDSDTSVESQALEEQLFITEEEDEEQSGEAASDPLLPRGKQQLMEVSPDYQEVDLIEPMQDDNQGDGRGEAGFELDRSISGKSASELQLEPDFEAGLLCEFSNVELGDESNTGHFCGDSVVELEAVESEAVEDTAHRLAEDFEEFMKSKRKRVDDIVGQNMEENIMEDILVSSSSEDLDLSIEKAVPETTEDLGLSIEKAVPVTTEGLDRSIEKALPETTDDSNLSIEKAVPVTTEGLDRSIEKALPEATEDLNLSNEKVVPETTEDLDRSIEKAVPETTEDLNLSIEKALPETTEDLDRSIEKALPEFNEAGVDVIEHNTKLPDIIQTVREINRDKETNANEAGENSENEKLKPASQKDDQKMAFLSTIEAPIPEIKHTLINELENTTKEPKYHPSSIELQHVDDTCDLPWFLYLALASCSTLAASYTNLSPFYYILVWVAISFITFHIFVKEERPNNT